METEELRLRLTELEKRLDAIGNMIYFDILGNKKPENRPTKQENVDTQINKKKHQIKMKEEKEI